MDKISCFSEQEDIEKVAVDITEQESNRKNFCSSFILNCLFLNIIIHTTICRMYDYI